MDKIIAFILVVLTNLLCYLIGRENWKLDGKIDGLEEAQRILDELIENEQRDSKQDS